MQRHYIGDGDDMIVVGRLCHFLLDYVLIRIDFTFAVLYLVPLRLTVYQTQAQGR